MSLLLQQSTNAERKQNGTHPLKGILGQPLTGKALR